jgi:hypothetical protein
MGDAKIAAGVTLKFLGKLTYPEKCPLAAAPRISFRCGTLPRIFDVRSNLHVCLLPDSCVSHVIVRTPDFSMLCENIAATFLGIFLLKKKFENQKSFSDFIFLLKTLVFLPCVKYCKFSFHQKLLKIYKLLLNVSKIDN